MFIYHPTDLLLMILYVVIPDYFFKTILLATSRYNAGTTAHKYVHRIVQLAYLCLLPLTLYQVHINMCSAHIYVHCNLHVALL